MSFTVTDALVIGINALTGAVVFLFGLLVFFAKDMRRVLNQKEKEIANLNMMVVKLAEQAGWIKFCPNDDCPVKKTAASEGHEQEEQPTSTACLLRKTKTNP